MNKVRNLAFEATKRELRELFGSFGHLKAVRLPKKFDGNHRGYAFVEYLTKEDAKNAFEALSRYTINLKYRTHFYGRKLVLEWSHDVENDFENVSKKMKRDMESFLAE